ncbi:methylmalonyl-CoA mutase family protein [Streptomyces sp. NPDC085540]|uniref:methylmalonyl-CoA mutase family protein n=1 Tax=Streptomyces sp. NPDC085540 TaxID=3365730 RepID=UPI0037D4590F
MTRESGPGLPVEPETSPGFQGSRAPMRAGRPRPVREYAGLGSVAESNAWFKQLVASGSTSLPVAFDLPSRMGHDSDSPIASGSVGRAGVAIDSIDDMRVLFGGIPLAEVSTSLQIHARGGAPFLLLCQLVGEEQGVAAGRLAGTVQSDVLTEYVLKEYVEPEAYAFPPEPSMRLIADVFRYCEAEMPKWGTAAAGLDADEFAPRLSFLFASRTTVTDLAIEVRQAERLCKLRAVRDFLRVNDALVQLKRAAEGTDNVLYPMKEALAAYATVGEVWDVLREVWGTPSRAV